jgi:hypothetical protein
VLVHPESDAYGTSYETLLGIVLDHPWHIEDQVYTVLVGGRVRFIHSRWLFHPHAV